MNKTDPSTVILASTRGKLLDYLRGVMDSVNSEFAPSRSKNECTRTNIVCFSLSEVSTGTVALLKTLKTRYSSINAPINSVLAWFD